MPWDEEDARCLILARNVKKEFGKHENKAKGRCYAKIAAIF
jgi:ribosomal protein S24E